MRARSALRAARAGALWQAAKTANGLDWPQMNANAVPNDPRDKLRESE
jgi:hypothetical protein